ncbi:MAG: O-antigen ligase family protein [Acetatifactor sp.]
MKKEKIEECLRALANAWMILILGVLPLYMKNGFVMIGSEKYLFYRNVSLTIVLLTVPMLLVYMFQRGKPPRRKWSITDAFVTAFAVCSVLSFAGSIDRNVAFWGINGWYMGLLSQMLFVWSFFYLSYYCDNQSFILKLAAVSAGLVMLLGALNRFDIDLLGVYRGISDLEWNKRHQISTIGNNNWYAGYISIMGGIFLAAAYEKKGVRRIPGMLGTFVYFVTVLTQGSTTAILSSAAVLLVLLFLAVGEREKLLHLLEISALLPAANLFGRAVIRLRLAGLVMESDAVAAMFFHPGWYGLAVISVAAAVTVRWRVSHKKQEWHYDKRICRRIMGIVLLLSMVALVCVGIQKGWDAGRMELWSLACRLFGKEGVWAIFFGVGPDCFYQTLLHCFPEESSVLTPGIWQGAIRANAHSEWLTMLVNEGIFGLAAYLGIFIPAMLRLGRTVRKNGQLLGIFLGLTGYLVCACFTFQQVMSTPFAFAFLGMAEAEIRKQNKNVEPCRQN